MAQNRPSGKNRRDSRRALVISVALHLLVGAGLIRVLLLHNGLPWFHMPKESQPHVEHLRYVALPPGPPTPVPARPTPPPAHVTPPPSGPTVVAAPSAVPTNVPAPAPKAVPTPEVEGVGPVAATGGPGSGARMEYHANGKQVWVGSAAPGTGERPLTTAERLDSAAHAITGQYNDSVLALGPKKQPGDWTKTIGGKKWGMDQQYIHLGPIAIPNAILAALPLNTLTGNPIAAANEKLINYRSGDIEFQRNRALDEQQFNKQVKEERLRKEREHEAQQQKKEQSQPSTPTVAQQQGGSPPTQ